MALEEPVTSRASGAAPEGRARRALVRSVALPSEHGGWSFLLEPALLGLAVAWSGAGLALAISALGAFLAHQPLKTAVKDRLAGRRAFRTVWAERFAILYGLTSIAALAAAIWAGGWRFLVPLFAGLPFAAVQLVYDARNRSRALAAEICGAAALATVASAIAVLDGWAAGPSFGLWLVLVARAAPSILYVRARLKLERDKPVPRATALAAHVGAVAATAAGAAAGLVPWLACAAMALLLARAAFGLSAHRAGRRPATIGVQEIVFGLVTIALVAVGY